MNILLLEDDIALNKVIRRVLEIDHHNVSTFTDGLELLESLDQKHEIYILDINVPNISGLELLDIILGQNPQAKVIMISSNTDLQSLQTAYDLGCVDYLKKPFHITELRAKINRLKSEREHLVSLVNLKDTREVLTKKEKRLLNILLDNQTHTVTYDMIEQDVYENKPMSMDALRALVRRLRVKLADDIIENVIDEGYSISNLSAVSPENQKSHTEQNMEALQEENRLLKLEKEVLLKKSTTDPLTGLYNRVKMEEVFLCEQKQFIRHGDAFSMILMDLDNFKAINDTHGHNIGDNYLRELAGTLTEFFRKVDMVGRWGGEEFLILLPRTSLDEANQVALRLRDKVSAIDCPMIGRQTASFGLATLTQDDTLSTVVGRADKGLFLAKERGKNRVEITV